MLLVVGLVFGYFMPGAAASRLLLKRIDPGFSFLVSGLVLTLVLTFLNIYRLPATLMSAGAPMVLVFLVLAACVWKRDGALVGRDDLAAGLRRISRLQRVIRGRWMALFLLAGVAVLSACFIYKEFMMPLTGADVAIRWEYQASRAFEQGNFHFYPAITDADFMLYSLPDAMGLMVSGAYWWAYALAGRTGAHLCAPAVVMQFFLVMYAAWSLARTLGARVMGGLLCVFLVGGTGVVTYGVFIGQEMGLLILGCLVLMNLAARVCAGRDRGWGVWVAMGLVAGAAALTREYGAAYLFIGLLACWRARGRWADAGIVLAAFAASAGPWLGYVWLLTGNPFYTIDVGGIFPATPELYASLMKNQREVNWGYLPLWIMSKQGVYCLIQSVPGVLGLGALMALWRKRRVGGRAAPVMLFFGLMMFGLCFWGYFSGMADFYYAYRVFGPGLALFAVALGVWAAPWLMRRGSGWRQPAAAVCLCVVLVHGVLTILVSHNYAWRAASTWVDAARARSGGIGPVGYQVMLLDMVKRNPERFEGKVILSCDAYLQRSMMGLPVRVKPAWSPGMHLLFAQDVSVEEVRASLVEAGVGFVMVDDNSVAEYFWQGRSPWFMVEGSKLYPRAELNPGLEIRAVPGK
jgi:hypothetical protein